MIGQAAKAAGVTTRAVRLYESRGLLATASRTESGYRLFTEDDIETLAFLRRGRALGLPLDAIAAIIEAAKNGPPCDRTHALLETRIAEINSAIADLQHLREAIVSAQRAEVAPASGTRCAVIEQATPGKNSN